MGGVMVNSTSSLDFALSYQDKKSAGLRSRQSLLDFGTTTSNNSNNSNNSKVDATFGPTSEITASLFDDWLSSDLQQAGFAVPTTTTDYDSSSSSSDSESSSPTSSHQHILHSPILLPAKKEEEDSPVVGFASLDRDLLIQSPKGGIDSAAANMTFFPDLQKTAYGRALAASANLTALAQQQQQQQQQQQHPQQQMAIPLGISPLVGLTPESVQQAAAALNIPWSKSLEQAVLAQSLLASTYRSATLTSSKRDRDRELLLETEPPSVLDGKDLSEMDEVSLKRAKNTDAARRSRHKKLIKMESLEQRVAELEVENSMFESKLNEVELERSLLADKDSMQQARIQDLEHQLLLAAAVGQQHQKQHHY
ncbi:hypothetical protein BGZ96_005159 [Linnemannia gamsii]|uniref:BZIP domain-containing protein n=1 Tax=Linnemannia gamsii TaxID=64522 RepID=A0ABQ7KFE9_9FUNG|nr:hypothetical protein BGZ96_005159 [Linnemannia gamsii]